MVGGGVMSLSDNPDIPRLDPWSRLRVHTSARIGLGRVGDGLPTCQLLEFQMAHARARDSVHMPFDASMVGGSIADLDLPVITVQSRAANRAEYLQRPDYGRKLAPQSETDLLDAANSAGANSSPDIVFILADGLSARAIHENGADMVRQTLALLQENGVEPEVVGRLCLGLQERPGLSSADSLGAYLTYAPKPGCSNAQRNCISNIRPAGFPVDDAAQKLVYLMNAACKSSISGVNLKDNFSPSLVDASR